MNKFFLNLGSQPLANDFRKKYSPFFYNLKLSFNTKTKIVSINKRIKKEIMFNKTYPYRSSKSLLVKKLSKEISIKINKKYKFKNILEIGSNDGTFAENFKRSKIVSIEPCKNVAAQLKKKGIKVYIEYFDKNLVKKLKKDYLNFDVIYSANTITHINNLNQVLNNLYKILSEQGTFILEEPSLLECYKTNSFDQFYNEHIYVLSAIALKNYLSQNKMEIYKIENVKVHGGSLRYFIKKKINKTIKIEKSVEKQVNLEKKHNLDKLSSYKIFAKKVYKIRKDLVSLFKKIKSEGGKVIGYGASAKAVTVINFCNLKEEYFDYFFDTTDEKIGKLVPGTKITVKRYKKVKGRNKIYFFLGAWNFKDEILKKENTFLKNNGKFITHLPTPKILRYSNK